MFDGKLMPADWKPDPPPRSVTTGQGSTNTGTPPAPPKAKSVANGHPVFGPGVVSKIGALRKHIADDSDTPTSSKPAFDPTSDNAYDDDDAQAASEEIMDASYSYEKFKSDPKPLDMEKFKALKGLIGPRTPSPDTSEGRAQEVITKESGITQDSKPQPPNLGFLSDVKQRGVKPIAVDLKKVPPGTTPQKEDKPETSSTGMFATSTVDSFMKKLHQGSVEESDSVNNNQNGEGTSDADWT